MEYFHGNIETIPLASLQQTPTSPINLIANLAAIKLYLTNETYELGY